VNQPKTPEAKRFLLLLLAASVVVAFVFGILSILIDRSGGDPLPEWLQTLTNFAGFVWAWQRSGIHTVFRLRERLERRWLP
jgi:hypothetical protein